MKTKLSHQMRDITNALQSRDKRSRHTAKLFSLYALLDQLGWMVACEDPNQANTFYLRGQTKKEFGKDRIDRHELVKHLQRLERPRQLTRSTHLFIWKPQVALTNNNETSLSKREKEVYNLLLAGLTLSIMADELGISQRTVEKHVENIYKKKDVKSYNELLFSQKREPI